MRSITICKGTYGAVTTQILINSLSCSWRRFLFTPVSITVQQRNVVIACYHAMDRLLSMWPVLCMCTFVFCDWFCYRWFALVHDLLHICLMCVFVHSYVVKWCRPAIILPIFTNELIFMALYESIRAYSSSYFHVCYASILLLTLIYLLNLFYYKFFAM